MDMGEIVIVSIRKWEQGADVKLGEAQWDQNEEGGFVSLKLSSITESGDKYKVKDGLAYTIMDQIDKRLPFLPQVGEGNMFKWPSGSIRRAIVKTDVKIGSSVSLKPLYPERTGKKSLAHGIVITLESESAQVRLTAIKEWSYQQLKGLKVGDMVEWQKSRIVLKKQAPIRNDMDHLASTAKKRKTSTSTKWKMQLARGTDGSLSI